MLDLIATCSKSSIYNDLALGVKSGIINLGGNVLTIGHSPDNPQQVWMAGIQNPLAPRGSVIRAIPLKDTSIVTSGINERFFHANGQLYHHLLDSLTGMPISTDIASITIISQHSVDGEIWSTAGFLSTVADSICYLNKQDNIEVVIISKNGTVHLTHGLADNGSYIYPTNQTLSLLSGKASYRKIEKMLRLVKCLRIST